MSFNTKKKFFFQGAVLTGIAVLLRLSNIWYRSFLAERLGADGLGLYQLIFSLFFFTVTLSTSGISLAVTRMVSRVVNSSGQNRVPSLVARCFAFCLVLSLTVSALLFIFAEPAAASLLGNIKAAASLRMLGLGLPFMSLCTCMKGYYLAVGEAVSGGAADLFEQIVTVGGAVLLFDVIAPGSIEDAVFWAMFASSIGEISSALWDLYKYRKSIKKNCLGKRERCPGVLRGLLHIALPCTLSSGARSLLSSAENLLIPYELRLGGSSFKSAMSAYGVLQGMAMPIICFPSAFLFSFANLLIPGISSDLESERKKHLAYVAGRAVEASLSFGVICAAIFFGFSSLWGDLLFPGTDTGHTVRLLSPLAPLIYMDVVVDNLLKGLDRQLNSMIYNLMDSALRVLLILILLSEHGINSYICIIYFSAVFNGALSTWKMMSTAGLSLKAFSCLIYALPAAIISVVLSEKFTRLISFPALRLISGTAFSIVVYCFLIRAVKNRRPKDLR